MGKSRRKEEKAKSNTSELIQGDMVHGVAMDNALTNGALILHMYLSPGATLDRHSQL